MSELSNVIAWVTAHNGLATWLAALVSFATFVKTVFFKKNSIEKWSKVGERRTVWWRTPESAPFKKN